MNEPTTKAGRALLAGIEDSIAKGGGLHVSATDILAIEAEVREDIARQVARGWTASGSPSERIPATTTASTTSTAQPSSPCSKPPIPSKAGQMSETLSAEDVRSLLATTDPLDIGLEARLIRSLDAATRRAEQAESAVEPLTREIIEDRTMFLWGELDDGKGERWLQHDGAGNAWTPMPEVFELLALVTGDEYRDAALHTADRPQSTRPRRR